MSIDQKEIDVLREIAYAADSYQLMTKYIAGDFSRLYTALEKWREYKRRVIKDELGVEILDKRPGKTE
jgi:hypothetical protein